jgi:hypothetical protein
MRGWVGWNATGVLVGVIAASASARADDPSAIAEALFRSGRELMAAEKYAEACPKFAESERVDPKPGTLMNLALCHEKTGKTASAWAEYLEAAETARRVGESARERVAHDRAAALEPTLSHVVIDADPTSAAQVALDDRALGPGAFGTAIPIDPGDHVLHASALGKKSFSQSFSVTAGAEPLHLAVPALDPDVPLEPEPAPGALVPESGRIAPSGGGISGRVLAGYVSGGAGLVLLGVGAFFGVRAFAEKRTVDENCSAKYCYQSGLDAIQAMKTAEAVSTLTIAGGVVAIGGGIYLVLSSRPRSPHPAATLQIGPDFGIRGARMAVSW